MRVNAVITNLFYPKRDYQNNLKDYSAYMVPVSKPDSFSFQGKIKVIKTAKEFKQHAIKKGCHCMYCFIPLKFDEAMFNEWKRQNLFSTPIKTFIKKFKPYKKCLHSTEKDIFSFIEFISKESPDAHLDTVIKMMSVSANAELLKAQEPIFEAIRFEAEKLPAKNKELIEQLLEKNRKRMLHIEYIEEYSGKELKYQIDNLAKTLPDEKLEQRIEKLTELLTLPALKDEPLSEQAIRRILRTIEPNVKINKTDKLLHKYTKEKLIFTILDAIKSEVKDLKRKDIYNLCIEGEKELRGEPIMRKFTNKGLMHDLKKALEGLEENPSRSKIFEHANNLPTSRTNIYAFITKHDQSSSEKIAYDLFTPSEITLEHMKPKSEEGLDSIVNFAMACKRCNNSRQSGDMGDFYKQFRKSNAQKYWNEIIEEANKGYFDYEDVKEMLKIFREQSKIKIKSKNLKHRK